MLAGRTSLCGQWDIIHLTNPVWSIEVKEKQELPEWLLDALSQAKANCKEGTTPLLILHLKGADHVKDLVIYEAGDWLEWYG